MIMLKEPEAVRNAKKENAFLNREYLLYDLSGIRVRPIRKTDRFELKLSDQDEVFYSHGYYAREALEIALENTLAGFTVLINDRPEICFGINAENLLGNEAIIWMLSSERIKRINYRFAKYSRTYVDYFLTYYSRLYNYVHVNNIISINWLRFLGAKFDKPEPYGVHQKPFMKFWFER